MLGADSTVLGLLDPFHRQTHPIWVGAAQFIFWTGQFESSLSMPSPPNGKNASRTTTWAKINMKDSWQITFSQLPTTSLHRFRSKLKHGESNFFMEKMSCVCVCVTTSRVYTCVRASNKGCNQPFCATGFPGSARAS